MEAPRMYVLFFLLFVSCDCFIHFCLVGISKFIPGRTARRVFEGTSVILAIHCDWNYLFQLCLFYCASVTCRLIHHLLHCPQVIQKCWEPVRRMLPLFLLCFIVACIYSPYSDHGQYPVCILHLDISWRLPIGTRVLCEGPFIRESSHHYRRVFSTNHRWSKAVRYDYGHGEPE